MREITKLLKAWADGNTEALDQLWPLVDPELKKIAHNYMRNERPGNILQTTALVHEALIRLIQENIRFEDRGQFYGFVAKRMRQVLVDYAKRQLAAKRGKRPELVDISEAKDKKSEMSKELLMLEAALRKLAEVDERKVTIIECRFFIGLSLDQIAKVLNTSPATIEREWRFARAWLKSEMTEADVHE